MLSKAGRLCAMCACLILASCGRIGVFLIPEELVDPDIEASPPEDDADAAGDADAALDMGAPGNADAGTDAGFQLDGSDHFEGNTPLDATLAQDASNPQDANGAQDASPDALTADSGGPADAAQEASLPACSGARVLGLCWYLGALGESCEQTCTSRGGYDARTASTVGTLTQGGSLANCTSVLNALGHTGPVGAGQRMDGRGIGCHEWDPDAWWIQTMPDFDPTSSIPPARIACACLR